MFINNDFFRCDRIIPVFNAVLARDHRHSRLIFDLRKAVSPDSLIPLMILCMADDGDIQFYIEEHYSDIVAKFVDTVFTDWVIDRSLPITLLPCHWLN